jgi:hypothetical protein
LVEVPSDQPDQFLPAVRLASLEALRARLGNGLYEEALRQLNIIPPRLLPVERQGDIEQEAVGQENGTWNDLRYWFTE